MTETPEQLLASLREIKPTSEERTAMRHALTVCIASYVPSRRLWAASFVGRHAVASFAVGLLVIATTATGLAQRSLPGDTLYPLKTVVNDRVRSGLAVGEDAKLDVELEQIARALAEEEQVAGQELEL